MGNVTYLMLEQRWVKEERNNRKEERGKNEKKKRGILCLKFDWLVQFEWAAVEGKLGVMVESSFVGIFLGGERWPEG